EAHQRCGLMSEAVAATLSWAFSAVRLHRVQAAVMPRNTASLRVVARVGFRREGVAERYLCIAGSWEDHVIFAVTAEEWLAKLKGEDRSTTATQPIFATGR